MSSPVAEAARVTWNGTTARFTQTPIPTEPVDLPSHLALRGVVDFTRSRSTWASELVPDAPIDTLHDGETMYMLGDDGWVSFRHASFRDASVVGLLRDLLRAETLGPGSTADESGDHLRFAFRLDRTYPPSAIEGHATIDAAGRLCRIVWRNVGEDDGTTELALHDFSGPNPIELPAARDLLELREHQRRAQ